MISPYNSLPCKLIAPTDFTDVLINAVNYAANMALAMNADLLVLHATELPFIRNETFEEPVYDGIDVEINLNH